MRHPNCQTPHFAVRPPDQSEIDRYETYCDWCENLLIVPAEFDTWKREQGSISEFAYS